MIEIWEPRWRDRKVLIACHKISTGRNLIRFTKAKSLPYIYEVDGKEVMSCPVETNGRIDCYSVPLAFLKVAKIQMKGDTPVVAEQLNLLQSAT